MTSNPPFYLRCYFNGMDSLKKKNFKWKRRNVNIPAQINCKTVVFLYIHNQAHMVTGSCFVCIHHPTLSENFPDFHLRKHKTVVILKDGKILYCIFRLLFVYARE